MNKKLFFITAGLIVSLFLLSCYIFGEIAITAPPTAQNIEVHLIDVGQGDSILIKTDTGKNILIDGGGRDAGPTLVKYIQQKGVKQIDLLVSTHPHEDHIGGLRDVLRIFTIKKILDSGVAHTSSTFQDYLNQIFQKKIPYETPDKAKQYNYDGLILQVLGPIRKYENLNNNSIILKLIFKEFKMVFTGDAETEAEQDILSKDISADILKIGHHGSSSSTSAQFLKKVKPKEALISLGKGNTYGHPHKETIIKLNNAGVNIYRTDEHGTVIVFSAGKGYQIKKELIGSTTIPAPVTVSKFVGSKNSDKYHWPSCDGAQKISVENRIWFKTAQEAIKAGYSPCKSCNPPTK